MGAVVRATTPLVSLQCTQQMCLGTCYHGNREDGNNAASESRSRSNKDLVMYFITSYLTFDHLLRGLQSFQKALKIQLPLKMFLQIVDMSKSSVLLS